MNWAQVSLGGVTLNAVVSGITTNAGHRIVAVGNSGAVYVSADGSPWAVSSVSAANLTDVAFSQGQFIAVADNGGIFTSADGTAWTTSRPPVLPGLFGVHALGDNIVAVGNNRIVVYSPDSGVTWHNVPIVTGEHLTGVAGR